MDEFGEQFEDVEVIYLDEQDDEPVEEILDNANFIDEPNQPNIPDTSKLTFKKHSKSVFCGDLTKDGQLAVTGGEDDNAYLWSTQIGEFQFECSGHKDSITAVCFNHDNQLLATGDMAGMIQVWNVKDRKLVWCYEGDDMEWLIWHPLTNILLSGSQSGEVYIWQVPQGNCKVLTSHGSSCTSSKVLPDGKHILTGYEDGQVKLWDIKNVSVNWNFLDPRENVTSIELNSDGTLCSLAPSSNLIKVADGKLISTLLLNGETDIEAHIFSSELNLLITGSLNGQICVWDLQRQVIRHQAKLDCGVTVIKLGLNGKIFLGTTSGATYVCDVRSGSLIETLTGHTADILSLCVSSDGSIVLTTSDDKTAKIFTIQS